jgi:hypothetical protein
MNKDVSEKKPVTQPIEKHDTAAWADINENQPVSNVPMPSDFAVENAKKWVDTNQK